MTQWSVYLIRAADNSLYTGITTDVERRFAEHSDGRAGARYLRGRGPLDLMYQQEIGSRSLASKVEYAIKQLPRTDKCALIARAPDRQDLLASLAIDVPVTEHQGVSDGGQPDQQT